MDKLTSDPLRTSGGLTDTFIHCGTCMSEEDFNALRHQEFSVKETHILHGQLSGSVSGVMARGSVASNNSSKKAKEHKNRKRRAAQIAEIIEQIRNNIEKMEAEVKRLEDAFNVRDGEEWREKLALEILDEDEIPQRNPDERMGDYRERLEKHLIEEMLNPDSTINDEYKDHPKYGDYAEWAQKQFNLKNAKALTTELEDSETTLERRTEILDEMRERGYTEEQTYAAREATHEDTKHQIKMGDDVNDDTDLQSDHSFALNKFLDPKF
jgi:hypothetical protein